MREQIKEEGDGIPLRSVRVNVIRAIDNPYLRDTLIGEIALGSAEDAAAVQAEIDAIPLAVPASFAAAN